MSAAGTPYVLATVVRVEPPASARPGDKAVITADGRLTGWIGGSCSEPVVRREALNALAEGVPQLVRIVPSDAVEQTRTAGLLTMATTCPSGGSLEIFIEPQLPKPLLAVFGDSPAAHALVELGRLAGFRTCALHPGARQEDFPGADLVLGSLDLGPARPGPDSWAVVATMGHYDEDALACALGHADLDVALIASRRRAAAVTGALRRRGLDDATLGRVRSPGGPVRGSTQPEIAILTMADVVTTRSKRGNRRPPSPALEAFATDPVCGMAVDIVPSAPQSYFRDRSWYFCCEGCRETFAADPERYVQRLGA